MIHWIVSSHEFMIKILSIDFFARKVCMQNKISKMRSFFAHRFFGSDLKVFEHFEQTVVQIGRRMRR